MSGRPSETHPVQCPVHDVVELLAGRSAARQHGQAVANGQDVTRQGLRVFVRTQIPLRLCPLVTPTQFLLGSSAQLRHVAGDLPVLGSGHESTLQDETSMGYLERDLRIRVRVSRRGPSRTWRGSRRLTRRCELLGWWRFGQLRVPREVFAGVVTRGGGVRSLERHGRRWNRQRAPRRRELRDRSPMTCGRTSGA
jgi:hypothetical protein